MIMSINEIGRNEYSKKAYTLYLNRKFWSLDLPFNAPHHHFSSPIFDCKSSNDSLYGIRSASIASQPQT